MHAVTKNDVKEGEDDKSLPPLKKSALEAAKALNTVIERAENNVENCEEIMLPRRLRDRAFDRHVGITDVQKKTKNLIF